MTDPRLKDAAIQFLKLAASGKVQQAFERYAAPNFIHHNPYFRGDAASLKQAMQENANQNPDKELDVRRALQEGQEVAVLSHVRHRRGEIGAAVSHIFRFEGGRIVELWDVGQEIPADSVNEHGMF